MHRYNDFLYRAHANRITAKDMYHLVLGPGLIGGTGDPVVHAFLQFEALLPRDLPGHTDQLGIIRATHIRKSRAERRLIHTDQRIDDRQADVVTDKHHIPHPKAGCYPAGGIGQQ